MNQLTVIDWSTWVSFLALGVSLYVLILYRKAKRQTDTTTQLTEEVAKSVKRKEVYEAVTKLISLAQQGIFTMEELEEYHKHWTDGQYAFDSEGKEYVGDFMSQYRDAVVLKEVDVQKFQTIQEWFRDQSPIFEERLKKYLVFEYLSEYEILCIVNRRPLRSRGTDFLRHHYYYNVTSSQAIQSREDTLTMGQIRRMVVLLDISHPLQRLLRCERLLRQYRGDQQQGLPEGQCWRPFFTRKRARTRK